MDKVIVCRRFPNLQPASNHQHATIPHEDTGSVTSPFFDPLFHHLFAGAVRLESVVDDNHSAIRKR